MSDGKTPVPARKTRSATRTSRRYLRITTALALVAFAALPLATLPSPSLAQTAQGGTLGIDCDKPRYDANGKLILDFTDGARQAICEAYRTTALTYADNVIETANRLRFAIQTLPPPVWDDLVGHLRTDDDVADWTFTDTVAMRRLETLSTTAPQTQSRDGQATSSAAHGVATHWQGGILARSGIGADWHPEMQARACGFDADDNPVQGAIVLVWLNPGVVRDSWTPRMVQRTALAWHERQSDRSAAINRVPHVLTAANRMTDARGRTSQVTGDPAIWTCLDTVPVGALVEVVRLRQARRDGERALRCEDPDEIGRRRFVWHRSNGVYMVPPFAVLDDGSDHPDRGEPLLGQRPDLPLVTEEPDPTDPARQPGEFLRLGTSCRPPRWIDAVRPVDCPATINGTDVQGTHVWRFRFREVQNDPLDPFRIDWVPVMPDPLDPDNELGVIAPVGDPHPEWAHVTVFCEGFIPPSDAPPVPPRVNDWTPDDCPTQWPGQFEQGQRLGYTQHFDYPAGWPKRDEAIRTVDDDCFNPVRQTGTQKRALRNCPAGMIGGTIEDRSFSWWTKAWAVGNPSHARQIPTGHGSVAQAAAAYDADPSQAGLDVWDVVTLEEDWHVVANTCRTPSSGGDDDDDDSGGGNYDVDGDGVGDFDNEADANAYSEHFGTPGSTVEEVDNCGDCQGHGGSQRPPSRPDQDEDSNDNEDSSGGGGGWG